MAHIFNWHFVFDLLAILAIILGLWVFVAGITLVFAPLGIWDVFDPFQPVQDVYEWLGYTDDDNDTGIVITLFLFPFISLITAIIVTHLLTKPA